MAMQVPEFLAKAAARQLLLVPFGHNQVRAVTHLDIDDEAIEQALNIISDIMTS